MKLPWLRGRDAPMFVGLSLIIIGDPEEGRFHLAKRECEIWKDYEEYIQYETEDVSYYLELDLWDLEKDFKAVLGVEEKEGGG